MRRVIMRRLALFLFVCAAGCAASSTPEAGSAASVKDRLAKPTDLTIAAAGSTGMITAERYTHDGWVAGEAPLSITQGELTASLDKTGKLEASAFEVDAGSIEIPETVFGKPAKLDDVRFTLAQPAVADVTWSSDDDATLTLTLALDLDASIDVNGSVSPLGTQHLPPVTITTAITGAGDHVDAQLSVDATGTLWNWADLFKLTELKLSLAAGSVDEM
jgi:hypothetical protein